MASTTCTGRLFHTFTHLLEKAFFLTSVFTCVFPILYRWPLVTRGGRLREHVLLRNAAHSVKDLPILDEICPHKSPLTEYRPNSLSLAPYDRCLSFSICFVQYLWKRSSLRASSVYPVCQTHEAYSSTGLMCVLRRNIMNSWDRQTVDLRKLCPRPAILRVTEDIWS